MQFDRVSKSYVQYPSKNIFYFSCLFRLMFSYKVKSDSISFEILSLNRENYSLYVVTEVKRMGLLTE